MSNWFGRARRAAASFVLLAASGLAWDARAQAPAAFPKTVIIIASAPAGGGYDLNARLAARHLGAFLPGAPSVVVQNMPGAGSLIAANWLANSAPRDGGAIAVLPNAVMFEQMLGNSAAHFDARRMNMIGSLAENTAVGTVWATTPFTHARQFLEQEVLVGASSTTSNNSVLPNLLNSLIHTKFKVIHGYIGSSAVDLAMERGEVQASVGADYDFMKATKPEWFAQGKVRILLQAHPTRHRELADVPTVFDFVPPENREVLDLLIARQTYGGVFVAPPDVPAANLAALRDAFLKMTADREFLQDAAAARFTVGASGADEITASLQRLLASSPAVVARATAELRKLEP